MTNFTVQQILNKGLKPRDGITVSSGSLPGGLCNALLIGCITASVQVYLAQQGGSGGAPLNYSMSYFDGLTVATQFIPFQPILIITDTPAEFEIVAAGPVTVGVTYLVYNTD